MLKRVTVSFHKLAGKHYQYVRRKVPVGWTTTTTSHQTSYPRPGAVRSHEHSLDAPRVIRARQGWPKWFNWPGWKNI